MWKKANSLRLVCRRLLCLLPEGSGFGEMVDIWLWISLYAEVTLNINLSVWQWWCKSLIPALRRPSRRLSEFAAILVYRAPKLKRNPASINQKTKQNKNKNKTPSICLWLLEK